MKVRILAVFCFSACIFAMAAACTYAQAKPGGPPPGPPPTGPGAGGGVGGPGAPGGPPPGGPRPSNTTVHANGGVQFGPVGRWWDDRTIARTVGLSSEQKTKMDAIFDSNKPAILAAYKEFLKQQSALAAISKDPHADKTSTFAAIDAVSKARDELQKATAQMYLEIRHQMNADQIERVEKLQ